MVRAAQIRAARGLLGWSQTKLAQAAGLALSTIKRMEASDPIRSSAENLWKVQGAIERGGVLFIEEDGEGVGVRFSPK